MLASCQVLRHGGITLTNDSYQYLSVAENLRDHHAVQTSIVYYDSERASRRIPAPLTTFPPGYPVAIWMFSLLGWSLPHSALATSLASSLAVLVLLYATSRLLVFPVPIARISLLLWALNVRTIFFSATALSETMFTAFVLGAIVLLIWQRGEPGPRRCVPLAFALIGVSYWIRYAGLFGYLGIALYAMISAICARGRRRYYWLVSLTAAFAVILLGMLRNIQITGTWRGGNTKLVHNSPALVLKSFGGALYRLIAGDRYRPGWLEFLLLAFLIVITAWVIWLALSRRAWRSVNSQQAWSLLLLAACIVVYCAGMVYAALVTVISFRFRMFFPLLPLLIVLAGLLTTLVWPHLRAGRLRLFQAVMVLFMVSYSAVSVRGMLIRRVPDQHQVVADLLSERTSSGEPLTAWLASHVPGDATIVAGNGQATGYLLRRPTLALTEQRATEVYWDEEHIKKLMSSYAADYLLLYTIPSDAAVQEELECRFLTDLASGKSPAWLQQAAANGKARVFRRVQ